MVLLRATLPRTTLARGMTALRFNALSVLIAGFGLLVLLLFVTRKAVARPLMQLAQEAVAVVGSGDNFERIRVARNDEIGDSARAFNVMLEDGVSFIQKPFEANDLLCKVRSCINGRPNADDRAA